MGQTTTTNHNDDGQKKKKKICSVFSFHFIHNSKKKGQYYSRVDIPNNNNLKEGEKSIRKGRQSFHHTKEEEKAAGKRQKTQKRRQKRKKEEKSFTHCIGCLIKIIELTTRSIQKGKKKETGVEKKKTSYADYHTQGKKGVMMVFLFCFLKIWSWESTRNSHKTTKNE